MTPVTDTYIHKGSVQRAIFLWASNRSLKARDSVINIIGTMTIAKRVCVSRIKR